MDLAYLDAEDVYSLVKEGKLTIEDFKKWVWLQESTAIELQNF